jgi:hypothetical protein
VKTRIVAFSSPIFVNKPVLADADFLPDLRRIESSAKDNNLVLFVTSSARRQGVPIGGAIVPPASRSNHLVGHAIDMNIQHDGSFFNGDALADFNSLPSAIQNFINSIRQDQTLRWGGDFNDPVHIDDGLNLREPSTWDQKFPKIQADLNSLTVPTTTPAEPRLLFLTQPFMRGQDVVEIQRKLIGLGFNISDDGIFGSATDEAVTAFQASKNLTADGVVGSKTKAALGL